MSLIRRVAAPLLERRSVEWGDSTPPTNGELGGTVAGTSISEKTALQVAAVYGSVGVIADSMATIPFRRYDSLDPALRRRLPPSALLEQPYAEISRIDWIVQFTISLALRGNFFGHIVERDADLYATQIKPIHPDRASVRRLPSGAIEYRFHGKIVPVDDVWHVRYLSVPGSLLGLNPIEYLRLTLGLARAQDIYGASFFSNSAHPSGILEVEGDLDEEETLALARNWQVSHQGLGKANMPGVLTNGATWKQVSITPEDSQFLESRQFSQGQISGMIFRVPPHMVGIVDRSTSWGTGIEQQERGFVTNTLSGYLGRAEEGLTRLHPPRQWVRADLNQRLRGDKLQRYQAYSLGLLGGFLCADDARGEEDLPPVPDGLGRTFMLPINSEPLKQALAMSLKTESTPPPSDGGPEGGGNPDG